MFATKNSSLTKIESHLQLHQTSEIDVFLTFYKVFMNFFDSF
mgnify:CR=1 FL=1